MKLHFKKRRGDRSAALDTKYGVLSLQWAAPGTIWYIRRKTPKKGYRVRMDCLLGLHRSLMREVHEYVYTVYVGRLQINWWHYRKDLR